MTSITVLTDRSERTFPNHTAAEKELRNNGWTPRPRLPGQWVKITPGQSNRFASVYDRALEPAFTAGLAESWDAATVASNRRVVYTVTVNGETHTFPGWHAAELMAKDYDAQVVIRLAKSQKINLTDCLSV
jgi:hypothetical protein